MKAMNFNEEIPALPHNLFQNHYVLVFDLTSLQDAGENIHYPELSGESIRLEMYFDHPLRSFLWVLHHCFLHWNICGLYVIVIQLPFSAPNNFLKWTLTAGEIIPNFLFKFLS